MIVQDLSNSFNPILKQKIKKHRTETVSDKTYKAVFERDKGKCQLCGISQQLELHHIKGRGKNLTNNVDNCIMLCHDCHHNVVHKNQKKYRPILIGIIERKNNNKG